MFKNYILIAIRTLKRKVTYSLINVFGLATSMFCLVFIYNWVTDELGFDGHLTQKDRLYRVVAEAGAGEERWHQAVTSLPLGPAMEATFPEVIAQVRIDKSDALIEVGTEQYMEDDIILTDPSFFQLFEQSLIRGRQEEALSEPYQVVLTETAASKFFGLQDPLGETLRMYLYDPDGQGIDYKVTGIISDPPENSHFTYHMLVSINTIAQASPDQMEAWGNNSNYTYVLLSPKSSLEALTSKLPGLVDSHMSEMIDEYDLYYRFYLQPIGDIHLHSNLYYEFRTNGSIEYVWVFSAVGLLILVLACINYINLATAFSLDRVKEMGVRKSLGARKSQLINQNLIESFIITLVAVLLAGLMVELLKPLFYDITGKYHILFHRSVLLAQLLALSIPLCLISGYVPGKLLSRVNTISSLKGKVNHSGKSSFRSILVTLQFAITLFLLIGLIVVRGQLSFVQSKDLGYDENNLLVIATNGSDEVRKKYDVFKERLLSSTSVVSVAGSGSGLGTGLSNSNARYNNDRGEPIFLKTYQLPIDFGYLETYQIRIAAGRDFSVDVAQDSAKSFIVNQSFARQMGWTEAEAVGKEISFRGRIGQIVGVVKNFHYQSLHGSIDPVCMYIRPTFSRITVRGTDSYELLNEVEKIWESLFPDTLFHYNFQDTVLQNSYQTDLRFAKIMNVFTVLSMFIAFMGLYGLIGYSVRRRTKEIGIRKVLGAEIFQVLQLISGSFLKLVILAFAISTPLSWWMADSWLSIFTYRMELGVWPFLVALVTILIISLSVVVIQSIRPATINPANSLKEE